MEVIIDKKKRKSGKTYDFADDKNPRLIADHWFQHTPEGLTLFLVFYTRACRYKMCTGCNLPSIMSRNHINYKDIMKQVDYVFHNILDDNQKKDLKKIIVSNNGSVLDEDTFSTTALIYLITKTNLECPGVEVLTLETRIEYADIEEVEVISRALHEGDTPAALEIAIGFEAFSDDIRNGQFRKALRLEKFEELVVELAHINDKLKRKNKDDFESMLMKAYFMLKPIEGMTEQEAIEDIKEGIDYLDSLFKKYDVRMNMHLNPTYVSKGTNLEKAYREGNYTPPLLESVREAALHGEGKNVSIYLGLYDEGLAVEGGSFIREGNEEDKKLVELLEEFNETQNYEILKTK